MTDQVRSPLLFPWPPNKKWPNPDAAEETPQLPTLAPLSTALTDGFPIQRKPIPPMVVGRGPSYQSIFNTVYLEGPPKPKYPESLTVQITTLLPTAPPPIHALFEGVPTQKKIPSDPRPETLAPALPSGRNSFEPGVPPRRYPPHIPVRVLTGTSIVPTALAQLETEFEHAPPKKRWPGDVQYPNPLLLPQVSIIPPVQTTDYPSKVRITWAEEAAYPNVAAQPPLIGLAQQQEEYEPGGPPLKRWPEVATFPNIAAEPVSSVPPIVTYEYPSKVRFTWPEDAALPNVAVLPAVVPPFKYEYPSVPRKYWVEDAAAPNIFTLPQVISTPLGQYDWPALPKKVWPDSWTAPNVIEDVSPSPIVWGRSFDYEWPKYWRLRPDFQSPTSLQAPPVPIYIPLLGFEIYIQSRQFRIAQPVRTFAITLPTRIFTVAAQGGSALPRIPTGSVSPGVWSADGLTPADTSLKTADG